MSLFKQIVEGKKEWKAHVNRVNNLPKDYQIIYKEVSRKFYTLDINDHRVGMDFLNSVVDYFEECVSNNKTALEIVGDDVIGFCNALIADIKK